MSSGRKNIEDRIEDFLNRFLGLSTRKKPSVRMFSCPFCLKSQPISNTLFCDNEACRKPIPRPYIREYYNAKPIWVHAVGPTLHGKTVYLTLLIEHIEKIAHVWEKGNCEILNQKSLDTIKQHREKIIEKGEMPDRTPKDFPEPVIIHIRGMRRWADRTFIMHDAGGETFDSMDRTSNEGRFIAKSNTTLFIISLEDIQRSRERRISDLLHIYLGALERLGSNIDGRNIIVLYTKADLIINEIPDLVSSYIKADNMWEYFKNRKNKNLSETDTKEYVENMTYMSNLLKEFTINSIDYGKPMINLAENRNINLRFAISSALGNAPADDETMLVPLNPQRVLDPFFWILELENHSNITSIKG